MLSTQRAARFIFYSAWAVLMTALTYILGAVSLKVLRRKFGRAGYWGFNTVLSGVMFALHAQVLAIAFFSLVVLVGVFSELEEMGIGVKLAAFFTLVINSLIASSAFIFWVYSTGPKWSQLVLTYLEALFKPLTEINPQVQINYFDLMLVLPSVILAMWLGALYVAILLESRLVADEKEVAAIEGVEVAPVAQTTMRQQLRELRLPDAVIWVFIGGLLGAFGGFGVPAVEAVSANVLNVSFILFFFQGVANVSRFFETIRMSAFWQTLFMALIVIYLFLFVSILGLTDYWFDFRSRMAKRTEEISGKLD